MGSLKKLAVCLMLFALGLNLASAKDDAPPKGRPGEVLFGHVPPKRVQPTYSFEEARSYTVSNFTLPVMCKESRYDGICGFFVNYFVSKFDHDYISFVTSHLNLDDPEDDQLSNREIAYQNVSLDLRVIKEVGFMCVEADISQEYMGEKALQKELYNFHLASNKIVKFHDLFERPDLAAMLCANIIEDRYKDTASAKNLAIVRAQIEVEPSNFIILPDGLAFVFNEGVLTPKKADSTIFIGVEVLKDAGPKDQWFPLLKKGS